MISRTRRRAISAAVMPVLIAAVGLTAARGQSASADAVTPQAGDWLAFVRTHAAGTADGPVVAISRWSREGLLAAVQRDLRETTDPALLAKALLLHTDAAIAERASYESGRGTGRTRSVLLLDAGAIGGIPASAHWEAGRLVAASLITRPGGPEAVERWYRATGALLQQWADCGALRTHLEAGVKLLPLDPVLLLYRGTLHQTFADPRVQLFIRETSREIDPVENLSDGGMYRDRSGNLVSGGASRGARMTPGAKLIAAMRIGGASTELSQAERDFRRALALDPGLAEAQIRLAHVLTAKDDHAAAISLARAALAAPRPPFLEYYAAMVLGRSEEALGRRAEAHAAFERASAVFPIAQSARVALSRYAVADSRPAEGVAGMLRSSGPDAPRDAGDPWWWYYRVHEPDSKALLAELRTGTR